MLILVIKVKKLIFKEFYWSCKLDGWYNGWELEVVKDY